MRFDRKQGQLDWNEGGLEREHSGDHDRRREHRYECAAARQDGEGRRACSTCLAIRKIRFASTRFERTGESRGTLSGDLTIRGVTQPVTLDVTFNGFAPDPLTKKDTLGFSADGHFSRAKFGLATWYPAVGDDIHVRIQAEFVKTPAGA